MRRLFLLLLLHVWLLSFSGCASSETESDDTETTAEESAAASDDFAEDSDSEFENGDQVGADDTASADDFEDNELAEPSEKQTGKQEIQKPVKQPTEDFSQSVADIGSAAAVRIQNLRFLGAENGGTVAIETSGPAEYDTRSNPENNQFIVEVKNAVLPEKLKRPYNTKDFSSLIASINAYQDLGSPTARIVIQLRQSVQPTVTQQNNSILISAGPSSMMADNGQADNSLESLSNSGAESSGSAEMGTPEVTEPVEVSGGAGVSEPSVDEDAVRAANNLLEGQTLEQFLTSNTKFYGRRLNIQIQDADVRDVLEFIAEESGLNLVISDEVKGNLTIKLRQVPWDQALVVILQAKSLGYIRQGNVLRVAPMDALRKESEAAKDILAARRELQPLRVKVITVSYADVKDLEKQITPFLSTKGKAQADVRTTSVVITDFPDVIERVSKLIKSLDIAPPQVLIEGKVMEVRDSFLRNLGVNFSIQGESISLGQQSDGTPIAISPSLGIAPTAAGAGSNGLDFQVTVGTLPLVGNITASLALSEREEKVKVISAPRIVTLSNEKSEIKQTLELPVVEVRVDPSGARTTSVSFKPITLKLEVTPQITADSSILLAVDILREFPGAIDPTTQLFPLNSRSAKTKILVRNGQTAVLGGIYQSDATTGEAGVPFIRKIPILGGLFEGKTHTYQKNELVIFLTPRILVQPTDAG